MYPVIGSIMRTFLPHLSLQGPIKSENIIGSIVLIYITTEFMFAYV